MKLEKFKVSFEIVDNKMVQVHWPIPLLEVISKGILELSTKTRVEKIKSFDLDSDKLHHIRSKIDEAIITKHSPVFNSLEWQIMNEIEILISRKSLFHNSEFVALLDFTLEEWDLLDQLNIPQLWHNNNADIDIPDYEISVITNRFDTETLKIRTTFFKIFGEHGFRNYDLADPSSYSGTRYEAYANDFSWSTSIGICNSAFCNADIGIIANPNDLTFLGISTFNCVIGCCGEQIGEYPVSKDGIYSMYCEIAERSETNDKLNEQTGA